MTFKLFKQAIEVLKDYSEWEEKLAELDVNFWEIEEVSELISMYVDLLNNTFNLPKNTYYGTELEYYIYELKFGESELVNKYPEFASVESLYKYLCDIKERQKKLMDVKIKKLNDFAKIPTRGSDEAAGYDLYAATDYNIQIPAHSTVKIDTGIAMEIPSGYFGGIYARSGIATKRGLRPANCTGVIDSDFRSSVVVALHNDTNDAVWIDPGERIAQLIIQKYEPVDFKEVDELSDTERGTGGFGSTGSK